MVRIAIVCCVLTATIAAADPAASLPPYRGARQLCSEHVTGTTMHISWTSWATPDDAAKVVAFYEHATGHKAKTGAAGERVIEADADHHADIYAAAKAEDFPHCDVKPKPSDATVILISQAIR